MKDPKLKLKPKSIETTTRQAFGKVVSKETTTVYELSKIDIDELIGQAVGRHRFEIHINYNIHGDEMDPTFAGAMVTITKKHELPKKAKTS